MKRLMTYGRDHRGITIVMIALMLFLLLALLGMAVDIASMYFTKNQLQVAADAAALAGVVYIEDPTDSVQTAARDAAIRLALRNKAGGIPVELVTDNTNTLSPGNDITVGYWDGTSYTAGITPINALEVRPQRVSGLAGNRGPVRVFIGQVFRFIGADWSFMSARASATAYMPPKASTFISLCDIACGSCIWPTECVLDPPRVLDTGPVSDPNDPTNETKFAWTTLLDHPTSSSQLDDILCVENPYRDVCDRQIYTTMGADTDTWRNYEAVMFDPNFDASSKQKDAMGNVIGWDIIIPVVDNCPPGAQGNWEPNLVTHYAKVHVRAICAPGVGNPCRPYSESAGFCAAYANNVIVIDSISCISCSDPDRLPGLKPALVK